MCYTIWVGTSVYVHAHTCPCAGVWPCTCVRAERWTRILLETLAVRPAANRLLYTQGGVLLTSLMASEGKDEGFLSPSNASVLPNGLETKVRTGGLSGREMQPEPCAGSRREEETIYWAPAQGWTARPLTRELTTCLLKQWCGHVTLTGSSLSFILNSSFALCCHMSKTGPWWGTWAEWKRQNEHILGLLSMTENRH